MQQNDTAYEIAMRAADAIRARLGADFPKTALVLGSGLGRFVEDIAEPRAMAYGEIEGFAHTAVAGHHGRLVVGKAGETGVAVMQGRAHSYEGHAPGAIALPIRALRLLGVERLILTNASGGLRPEFPAGTLCVIEDHINYSGINPLVGPNDTRIGPRFFDMSQAYDPEMRAGLIAAAAAEKVSLAPAVYLFTQGPNFETPAEVRMFARMGADIVGMSTVPECLAARHCGMKVAGLSLVTNPAAGLSPHPLSHDDTLAAGRAAADRIASILFGYLAGWPPRKTG